MAMSNSLKLLLISLCSISAIITENDIPQTVNIDSEEANKRLHDFLEPSDPYFLPYLPLVLNLSPERVDASLSVALSELSMLGLSNAHINVGEPVTNILARKVDLQVNLTFEEFTIKANRYSAGGHVMNLPFAGKSHLELGIQGLTFSTNMTVMVTSILKRELCFTNVMNTIELERLIVNFADLNPGEDSGSTINNVLGGFGDDIIKAIREHFSDDLSNLLDSVVVNVIGPIIIDSPDININDFTRCE